MQRRNFLLLFVLCIAASLRFFNLMHDAPYFFNPDERNMATAINQFKLEGCVESSHCNLNPHFFAYGQFPLYLAFFSHQIVSLGRGNLAEVPFSAAIFWLRFWSAMAGTATVYVVYHIVKALQNAEGVAERNRKRIPIFAALLTTFTPGLIQSVHFGTTESLLTFFFMVIIYLSLKLINSFRISNLGLRIYILFSIVMGLALATKLSALPFALPFLLAFLIQLFRSISKSAPFSSKLTILWKYWFLGVFLFLLTILVYVIASPYNSIEKENFRSATSYEIDVATGNAIVFYTRQFEHTIPVLFQIEKIFPYTLGPVLFISGTIGILLMIILFIFAVLKKFLHPNSKFIILNSEFIILVAFLAYFLPNAFLYAKWTRFMTPVMPLFSVFTAFFLFKLYKNIPQKLGYWVIGLLVIIALLPGLAFMSIYTHEDVRMTASRWIYENIPTGSRVLSETGNVIDIPLSLPEESGRTQGPPLHYDVISFDFYHLDENPKLQEQLINELVLSDYIFVPSRRLFANHLRLSDQYPILNRYYHALFSRSLGFDAMKRFTSYPTLKFINVLLPDSNIGTYDDEKAEETWTVFDHPVIWIYNKFKPLTREEYQQLLKI